MTHHTKTPLNRKEVTTMFKEHEKFWAFALLVGAIVGVAVISTITAGMTDSQARVLEKVNDGLLVVLGAAGLALFRTSETAPAMNELLSKLVDKASNRPATTSTITVGEGASGEAIKAAVEAQAAQAAGNTDHSKA